MRTINLNIKLLKDEILSIFLWIRNVFLNEKSTFLNNFSGFKNTYYISGFSLRLFTITQIYCIKQQIKTVSRSVTPRFDSSTYSDFLIISPNKISMISFYVIKHTKKLHFVTTSNYDWFLNTILYRQTVIYFYLY